MCCEQATADATMSGYRTRNDGTSFACSSVVQVLVSGPTKMADFVFADAATVDSGMFNVEALSRDF